MVTPIRDMAGMVGYPAFIIEHVLFGATLGLLLLAGHATDGDQRGGIVTGVTDEWKRPIEAVGLFLRGHTLRTAVPTALVVGTVLCAVNQGAILLSGQATAGTFVRMIINYLVPFIVASIGYLGARRAVRPRGSTPGVSGPDSR